MMNESVCGIIAGNGPLHHGSLVQVSCKTASLSSVGYRGYSLLMKRLLHLPIIALGTLSSFDSANAVSYLCLVGLALFAFLEVNEQQ